MPSHITVNTGSTSGHINVSSQVEAHATASTGNQTQDIEATNNAAYHWAEVAEDYANQAGTYASAANTSATIAGEYYTSMRTSCTEELLQLTSDGLTTIAGATTDSLVTINSTGTSYINTMNTLLNSTTTSTTNASIWAEGTDEEVVALGGTHSSKGWVDYVLTNPPLATVTQTSTGATVEVTDINGTTTANLYNGSGAVNDILVNGTTVIQDTIAYIDLTGYQDKLYSGTNIKTVNNISLLGEGNVDIDTLPSQTGNAGKYLTTDGTDASWDNVPTRNIGEIVSSTIPLTDAGLHLLDGSLLQYGSYKAYIDYMADLYDDNPPTPTYAKGTLITLPTFTSTTQDGITIADARSNTTDLRKIFNGTAQNVSIGHWSTYWISIDYGQSTILGSYTIQADNNGSAEYPSAWVVQGSNDGSTWVDIDSRTGITFSLNESKTFNVSTSTPYEQYKIVFSNGVEASNNGEIKRFYFSAYIAIELFENSIFATEAQWQQSVTDYGSCGKFVYDSVNNTVRLPKVSDILQGTTDLTALGDLTEAGLPNITGYAHLWGSATDGWSGAFFNSGDDNGTVGGGSSTKSRINFDASLSNSVYGNSPTVQPQTVKVLYYIVVATTTKTDIQIDIDEVMTDLAGKADIDLSNCTKPYVTTSYSSGTDGYMLFSNKDLIQWFRVTNNSNTTLTANLLLTYGNTNYAVTASNVLATAGVTYTAAPLVKSNNKFTFYLSHAANAVEYVDFIVIGRKS